MEGTAVKKGDLLVELDTAQLEQNEKEAVIKVITAESSVANAEALRAKAALAPLPAHPVKDMLTDLADYVVERIN